MEVAGEGGEANCSLGARVHLGAFSRRMVVGRGEGEKYHEASDGRDLGQINIKHPAPRPSTTYVNAHRRRGDSRGPERRTRHRA